MLFLPCMERKGTAYYEFQYCKQKGPISKLLKANTFWSVDSLLVHIDSDEGFMKAYGGILSSPHSPDGSNTLCVFGINYYDTEQTKCMIEKIKTNQPPDHARITSWLERAISDFNGFYFLGI